MTFLLISSFAAVMITTATRGHRLTNVNESRYAFLTYIFYDELVM